MVICLEQGADLHMAQLMPLPLTGFTFLVHAHLGSPGKRAVRRVCMYGMKKPYFGHSVNPLCKFILVLWLGLRPYWFDASKYGVAADCTV